MLYRRLDERDFVRFRLRGRLTAQDGDGIRAVIAEIKRLPDRRCLIDLTELEFIDSAGIGMLLVTNGETMAAGKSLALAGAAGQVQRVIALTQIAMIVPVHASVDDYIAARVPERVFGAIHPCAPGEDPLAVAARTLSGPRGP
ncbi:STAS domain-containing protein [Azospirillum halopraeferens]|uniref:STAS domain-containing protein n=1 Tax=Azospirillum halopraeferens TaxID=34010 RepID=UPI0004041308|nr:STAS domain-containing protein [Azospirillum halopraeferens]